MRWYLRFGLSYRDVKKLLTERGVQVDHVTVSRWVLRFTPLPAAAARPCRHTVGSRWHVDGTSVQVAEWWRYVDRAIYQFGQVIDVFVPPRRDAMAAPRCFEHGVGTTGMAPSEVATDWAPTYPRCSMTSCQRPGTAPPGTPTTGSRPTTVSPRRGCVLSEGADRTAAPGS